MAGLDLTRLREIMSARTGYALNEARSAAAESRLGPIARREGVSSVQALVDGLDESARPSLTWEIVEAMLPSDSAFYRDREPFRLLCSDLLPTLAKARGGRVRILSAGCASGQEVWSAAICAAEAGVQSVEIVGLDLSSRAVEKARQGLYTSFEVQKGLRSRQLINWFERSGDLWKVSDRLRSGVRIERANLIDGLDAFGTFDLIFCRNVLGDMTPAARARVVAALDGALSARGCLLLGAGELAPEALAVFRPVAGLKAVYVKGGSSVSAAA